MKSKVELDVVVDDETWLENVDFDAAKVANELKDIAFKMVDEAIDGDSLLAKGKKIHINVCLSNNATIQYLNKEFRGIDKPTNVLSFANVDDDEFWNNLEKNDEIELGEIVLAFETLKKESEIKNISVYAHYCHLLVHGFLHLLGFDHQEDDEAEEMEAMETDILAAFCIDNPYQEFADE